MIILLISRDNYKLVKFYITNYLISIKIISIMTINIHSVISIFILKVSNSINKIQIFISYNNIYNL